MPYDLPPPSPLQLCRVSRASVLPKGPWGPLLLTSPSPLTFLLADSPNGVCLLQGAVWLPCGARSVDGENAKPGGQAGSRVRDLGDGVAVAVRMGTRHYFPETFQDIVSRAW